MKKSIEMIDSIKWSKIPGATTFEKKALKEAIKKAGNCNQLALKIKRPNQMVYRWVYKEHKKGDDLMHPTSAIRIQKAIRIKGLAERLCPSLKKL